MKGDEIVIELNDGAPVRLQPGDALDLDDHGVIVWLEDEDAAAWRLIKEKRAREIRNVIAGRPPEGDPE